MEKLKILVSKALETVSLRKEVTQFRSQLSDKYGFESIIGESDEMRKVFDLLVKVAKSDASTIFIKNSI